MKFLCVPCDSPMKLQTVRPPESGSLSVVYSCPECGYEMAMLTNPFETQLVQSLGVRIGPSTELGAGPAERFSGAGRVERRECEAGASVPETKCPFPAMMAGMEGVEVAGPSRPASRFPSDGRPPRKRGSRTFRRSSAPWRGPASSNSPGSEEWSKLTKQILDAARDFFGM